MSNISTISEYLGNENALQDKIEITLGRWVVEAIDIKMSEFLQHLGDSNNQSELGLAKAFVSKNSIRDSYKYNLSILKPRYRNTLQDDAPLFSGKLVVTRIAHRATADVYNLVLHLSINPTRFCVYQEPPSEHTNSSTLRLSENTILFTKQDRTAYQDEESLDGKDNVILQPGAKSNSSDELWEQNLERYVQGIRLFFQGQIEAFESYTAGFSLNSYEEEYSIRKVENYWDIPIQEPLLFVKKIAPTFVALSNDTSIRTYNDAFERYQGSSSRLQGKYRNGEYFKIYAKTHRRIRLEVTHNFTENANHAVDRRYTVNNIEAFINFIDQSANVAKSLLDNVWIEITSHYSMSRFDANSGLTFVKRFYSIVNDADLAGDLLTELSTIGGVSSRRLSEGRRDALRALEQAGLVRHYTRPIYRYTVSPSFSNSVRALGLSNRENAEHHS